MKQTKNRGFDFSYFLDSSSAVVDYKTSEFSRIWLWEIKCQSERWPHSERLEIVEKFNPVDNFSNTKLKSLSTYLTRCRITDYEM